MSFRFRSSYAQPNKVTVKKLHDIIEETTNHFGSPSRFSSLFGFSSTIALPERSYDEVYPRLYIGNGEFAMDKSALKRNGITHVLNAAQGAKFCQINTNRIFYEDVGIHFMGVPAIDMEQYSLRPYFEASANFVEDGLRNRGKVLVHCHMGISRSATLALAYLMIKQGIPADTALYMVRKKRLVFPNDGFMQQLCDLNDDLSRKGVLRY